MLMMIIYNPKYSWCTCMYMYILHVTKIYITVYIYTYCIYIYTYCIYLCVCFLCPYIYHNCVLSVWWMPAGAKISMLKEWTSKPTTIFSYDHPSAHQFWDPVGDATLLHGWGMRRFDPCPNPLWPGRSCSPSIGSLADCLSARAEPAIWIYHDIPSSQTQQSGKSP